MSGGKVSMYESSRKNKGLPNHTKPVHPHGLPYGETYATRATTSGNIKKLDLLTRLSRAFHEKLSNEVRENYEERAAIMEYDGGLTRKDAETAAWKESFEK